MEAVKGDMCAETVILCYVACGGLSVSICGENVMLLLHRCPYHDLLP